MISPPVGIADTKNRVGIFWQLLSLGELIMGFCFVCDCGDAEGLGLGLGG
jgi:hypothetical protein